MLAFKAKRVIEFRNTVRQVGTYKYGGVGARGPTTCAQVESGQSNKVVTKFGEWLMVMRVSRVEEFKRKGWGERGNLKTTEVVRCKRSPY